MDPKRITFTEAHESNMASNWQISLNIHLKKSQFKRHLHKNIQKLQYYINQNAKYEVF